MKLALLALPLLAISSFASADDQSDCTSAAGTYLSGVVTKGPTFRKASETLKGIPLSHTHLTLTADQDGKNYDVAIDNVFATGYNKKLKKIPASLSDINVNDHLSVCGATFPGGIHWVHTNCGDTPSASAPNGWLKKVTDGGQESDNYEGQTTYCYLWPKKS